MHVISAESLQALVETADSVLSLLPATMHVPVADACITYGTPLVTASYASDEMQKLDARARQAKVPILCEMGLDPGEEALMMRGKCRVIATAVF